MRLAISSFDSDFDLLMSLLPLGDFCTMVPSRLLERRRKEKLPRRDLVEGGGRSVVLVRDSELSASLPGKTIVGEGVVRAPRLPISMEAILWCLPQLSRVTFT